MKNQLKMQTDDFLLLEIDQLRPALGPTRSEVVTHILRHWLTENGTKASAHVEHVKQLMEKKSSSRDHV